MYIARPGRRLSTVRSMIEKHIITQCGNRANIYSHYQYPLLAHLSFPLYTRNIERGSGDSDLGPGQLSLKSLWPVTLLGPTTSTGIYIIHDCTECIIVYTCSTLYTRGSGCKIMYTITC